MTECVCAEINTRHCPVHGQAVSASEKLKGLDADLGIFDGGMHWVDVDGPKAGEAVWKLKTALPQIVAVVEGLEDIVEKWPRGSYEIEQARDYLSALDEALS